MFAEGLAVYKTTEPQLVQDRLAEPVSHKWVLWVLVTHDFQVKSTEIEQANQLLTITFVLIGHSAGMKL